MTAIRYTPALRRRAAVIARLGAVGLIALLRARVIGSTRQVGVHANLSFKRCSYRLDIKSKVKITRSWKPWMIHAQANPCVSSMLLPHTRPANPAMATPVAIPAPNGTAPPSGPRAPQGGVPRSIPVGTQEVTSKASTTIQAQHPDGFQVPVILIVRV